MEETEEIPATVEVTAPVEEMPTGTTETGRNTTGRKYSHSEASSESYSVDLDEENVPVLAVAVNH